MFAKKGVRIITPDERKFALCFARTLSVKRSCAAAGFEGRTSFARASRLLERDDVGALVRAELLRETAATAPCGIPEAPDGETVPVIPDCVRETCGEYAAKPLHPEDTASETSYVSALAAPSESPEPAAIPPESASPCVSGTAHAPDNAEVCGTDGSELSYDLIEERILREYERIAFADTESGEVKIADKLRALEQYRAIAAARHSRDEGSLSLTVNYDYGDVCG